MGVRWPPVRLSIIIPAFSEEARLPAALDALKAAAARLRTKAGVEIGTIIVDNNSEDRTDVALMRGAMPFCRASAFEALGGYHEQAWIGEDGDFFRSPKRLAGETGRKVAFIRQPRVQPWTRGFDPCL